MDGMLRSTFCEVHAIYLALRLSHIWPGSLVRGHPAGWRMVRNLPGPPKLFGVFNLQRHQEVRGWLLSLEPSVPASSCPCSDRACLKPLHPHCVACCGNHCAHESAYSSSDHPLAYTRAQDTQPMHIARRAATVRSSLLPHRAWTLSYCMQPLATTPARAPLANALWLMHCAC